MVDGRQELDPLCSGGSSWNLNLSPLDTRAAAGVGRNRTQGAAVDVDRITTDFANRDPHITSLTEPVAL